MKANNQRPNNTKYMSLEELFDNLGDDAIFYFFSRVRSFKSLGAQSISKRLGKLMRSRECNKIACL